MRNGFSSFPSRRHSGIFIANFEHILHLVLVLLLLTHFITIFERF